MGGRGGRTGVGPGLKLTVVDLRAAEAYAELDDSAEFLGDSEYSEEHMENLDGGDWEGAFR